MPPAASPRVSENSRLMTSPSPIASSTTPHRPIAEVEHDLLPQSHDVADADHDRILLHEIEHLLVDPFRVEPPQVAEALRIQSVAHGLERHQVRALAGEHHVIGREPPA